MARPKKNRQCSRCGKSFDLSLLVKYQGNYYCETCAKPFKEEGENYKKLCKFIYEVIYNKDCNMPFITMQLKQLKNEFNFTYRGMLATLKYAIKYEEYDITDLNPKWGVYNIISQYYLEAKNFYKRNKEINNEDALIIEALTMEPKVVILNRSDLIKKRKEFEEERKRREFQAPFTDKDVEEIMEVFRQEQEEEKREKLEREKRRQQIIKNKEIDK